MLGRRQAVVAALLLCGCSGAGTVEGSSEGVGSSGATASTVGSTSSASIGSSSTAATTAAGGSAGSHGTTTTGGSSTRRATTTGATTGSGGAGRGATSGGSSTSAGGGSSWGSSSSGGVPYMVGYKLGLETQGASEVQAWLGRPLDVVGVTINTNAWIASGPFQTADGGYPLLEASFPLLSIYGESNDLDDMAQAASGAYDSAYTSMAKTLAAGPNPLMSVRIGWEFNGNWYAWSNGVGKNATYANYIAAFQRAAAIVKQASPTALVQWCVAWGQPDPMPYWPGVYDAATNPGGIDVISMDFYEANVTQYNNKGAQSTWAMLDSDATINLSWLVTTAQSQGVKIALSEYAAGAPGSKGFGSGPGLNDGVWTSAAIQWISGLPPGLFLWTDWSDDAPADDLSTATANPAEAQAWLGAWGGTHFAGTWWSGTPPPSAR